MRVKILVLCALVIIGAPVSHAALTIIQMGESGLAQAIPDYQDSGISRVLSITGYESQKPYTVTASIRIDAIGNGAYNGDYYAYLKHDTADGLSSAVAVLLNRPGKSPFNPSGYENSGMDISFADAAATDIHLYQPAANSSGDLTANYLRGTWQPDARNVNPYSVVAGDSRTLFLDSLGLYDPNGTWTLFVADVERGATGMLVSWSVTLTPTPEPNSVSLILVGLGAMWLHRRRRK